MSEIPPGVSPDSDDGDAGLPSIDDRLVEPGLRLEIIDGKLSYVPPAEPPHAMAHSSLDRIVGAHVDAAFTVALDMLTRTSRVDDIAPDVSVFPTAPDPATGRRQLEQVTFEIASTESLGHVAKKARKLATRGVRRVFALDLDRGRVLEWSASLDAWSIVELAHIVDPVFAVPLPVAPLLDAARLDDTIVGAYRARRHPAFLAERAEGEVEGRARGRALGYAAARAASILEILAHRGLHPTEEQAQRVHAEHDLERLERWAAAAWTVGDVASLLAMT